MSEECELCSLNFAAEKEDSFACTDCGETYCKKHIKKCLFCKKQFCFLHILWDARMQIDGCSKCLKKNRPKI